LGSWETPGRRKGADRTIEVVNTARAVYYFVTCGTCGVPALRSSVHLSCHACHGIWHRCWGWHDDALALGCVMVPDFSDDWQQYM